MNAQNLTHALKNALAKAKRNPSRRSRFQKKANRNPKSDEIQTQILLKNFVWIFVSSFLFFAEREWNPKNERKAFNNTSIEEEEGDPLAKGKLSYQIPPMNQIKSKLVSKISLRLNHQELNPNLYQPNDENAIKPWPEPLFFFFFESVLLISLVGSSGLVTVSNRLWRYGHLVPDLRRRLLNHRPDLYKSSDKRAPLCKIRLLKGFNHRLMDRSITQTIIKRNTRINARNGGLMWN